MVRLQRNRTGLGARRCGRGSWARRIPEAGALNHAALSRRDGRRNGRQQTSKSRDRGRLSSCSSPGVAAILRRVISMWPGPRPTRRLVVAAVAYTSLTGPASGLYPAECIFKAPGPLGADSALLAPPANTTLTRGKSADGLSGQDTTGSPCSRSYLAWPRPPCSPGRRRAKSAG